MDIALAPRTTRQLLGDRDLGTLFWGKLIVLAGVWAQMVVLIALTYAATSSVSWAGAVGAVQLAPQLALALVSGRMSDLHGPVRQMVGGGVLAGVTAMALSAWLEWGVDASEAVAPLLVASFVFGCGVAVFSPAMHSIVPRLVRPHELSSAVALNFFPTAMARTVGPAGGALLMAVVGPHAALGAIGVIVVAASITFCRIRPAAAPAVQAGEDRSVRGALRYVREDRPLTAFLMGVAVLGFGAEPGITLAPALAERVHHAGSGGMVTSSFGAGGLLGLVAHHWMSRRMGPVTESGVAMVTLGAAMAVAAFADSLVVLAAAMVVAGLAMVAGVTALSVAIQDRCRPSMLGRVMAIWVVCFAGVRPLAALTQGALADHVSPVAAVTCTSLVVLLATGWMMASASRPRRARRSVCAQAWVASAG